MKKPLSGWGFWLVLWTKGPAPGSARLTRCVSPPYSPPPPSLAMGA